MKYLYWTYVDAQTGIPCLAALMRHGPANPAVPGLQFGFALESRYPTPHPVFYGTCPADTPPEALALPGVLGVISEADYQQALADELIARRAPVSVTARQARLALAQAGLLTAVEDWVAASAASVQIEWEYATEIRRLWPPVLAFAAANGLSDDALDALFVQAAAL